MNKRLLLAAIFCAAYIPNIHAQEITEEQKAIYRSWTAKADSLYEAKKYKESGKAYNAAFAVIGGRGFSSDKYNAACSWSLAGVKDSAFVHLLFLAQKKEYKEYGHLTIDPDLKNLHTDKRWKEVLAQVKKNKDKAEEGLNKPLVAILDTVMETDQKYRMQFDDVMKKYGKESKEFKTLAKKMERADSINLIKVTAIIDKYGWPGPEMVGEAGNQAVFLVIQHADRETQRKYIGVMRDAVKAGKAEGSALALLEDRVALGNGEKQIYGSQIGMEDTISYIAPMIDPDNVDKRRAEVGLGPIAEYVKNWNLTWDVEAYKKQMAEWEKREKEANGK